jgi:S1-C subfamily serine protease
MKDRRAYLLMAVALLIGATMGCVLPSTVFVGPEAELADEPLATPTLAPLPEQPVQVEPANALEDQVIAVYGSAGPAVVNITSRSYTYDFFMRAVPQEGTGSGFIYDRDGHIITNYHVVEDAEELSVTLANGRVYPADLVGVDPSTDLAVIGIDAEDLPDPIPLGDSSALRVGQFVVAIGNPFGLEGTLTTGVVSSLGRVIESPDGRFIGEAIQTDAAINPGNSGGPLLDLYGRVVGVNSQIVSPSRASAGIGFAVPSESVRRIVPQLIATGRYPHPWVGVQVLDLTAERARIFRQAGIDVPVDAGMLVLEVVRGSAAESAGIQGGDRAAQLGGVRIPVGGDIIVELGGVAVDNLQELTIYLESETQVGDTVDVTVIREGERQVIAVTLAERPQ